MPKTDSLLLSRGFRLSPEMDDELIETAKRLKTDVSKLLRTMCSTCLFEWKGKDDVQWP
ncbi:MAG: hypothetical protein HY914_10205 [Desulfomonile tiedjei]|nr:hypothetical protein [Desulfomonile tiedjei]